MSVIPTREDRKKLRLLGERIRSRRTTRLYLKQPVDQKLILDAIEVARWAPNHHLSEPWHFYVLGPEKIAASLDLTRTIVTERKGAEAGEFKARSHAEIPGWMVVTCDRSEDDLREQEDYASCACAIQNLMLYLSEAGVATKWATGPITRDPRYYEVLGINREACFIVGIIWYGYPKVTPEQSRCPVDEITTLTD